MAVSLMAHADRLDQLARRDADPRVRRRAQCLIGLLTSPSLAEAARRSGVSPKSLRRWCDRFLEAGRPGLVDRPRRGRPPKLDARARDQLAIALAASPLAYGYPVATWTVADLRDLLARAGYAVGNATVNRALHRMGFAYRRPRHDLRHRQDAEAVAVATHTLAELQKRGRLPGLASASCTSMSAISTPTPTWQRSGNGGEIR